VVVKVLASHGLVIEWQGCTRPRLSGRGTVVIELAGTIHQAPSVRTGDGGDQAIGEVMS
jgi:hypothetical protein